MRNWKSRMLAGLITGAVLAGAMAGEAAAADNPLDKSKSTWKRPADWDAIVADPAKLDAYRCPVPTEFAFVYSCGYMGDDVGAHGETFVKLLGKLKAAGYNVIHCTYSDERLEACRKAGVKMMVQLLDENTYHVYKTLEKNPVLGKKLEGDPAVWGYNIWNDTFPKTVVPGRQRDIRNVRKWDPSHPAYMGGYMTGSMRGMTMADAPGYYDFHWGRGIGKHFSHSNFYLNLARSSHSNFYTWLAAGSGTAGEDNFRKSLWSTNTGIAFGLKGVLWFLSTDVINPKTLAEGPIKADLQKVHEAVNPMGAEIMQIGNPTAVYGTLASKDQSNKPTASGKAEPIPGTTPVPAEFFAQPQTGEFIMGVFKDLAGKDVLYVANYNALAPQAVKIKFVGKKVSIFDRKTRSWKDAPVADGVVSFPLEAGAAEMLKAE